MAKKDFENEDGIWRTVGGRRIFIRNGQALSDAMKESGKFKKTASGEVSRQDVARGKLEIKHQDAHNKANELLNFGGEIKDYKKLTKAIEEDDKTREDLHSYDHPKEYKGEKLTYLAGKHGNKDQVMTKEEKTESRLKQNSDAENYYSKLSEKQIAEDLEKRKYRLDNSLYDKEDEGIYRKFYNEGKKYYDEKYGDATNYTSEADTIEKLYNSNSISNKLQQKAYDKYMKEHPNSKMTFNEFKKGNK